MTRYSVTHPEPEEWHDLARYPAPVIQPRYRLDVALTVLAVAIVLAFGAWLVWPVIRGGIDRSTMEPPACRSLTPDECTARAQEGW
ncbi:hypothetical protein [Paracoccus sp. (in: a-proteobacteria)]|uniref:hypothetical protein n=1 Tax=Paracoccus sp. TaxID=267 RepID=UPI0028AF506D|nr:hypothetical protein [Paracoccus sp. (in: a-proteobacteria)]